MIELCNNAGQKSLSKDLNRIRGRALGRDYCDFTFECQQAIDSYPNCPKELVDKAKELSNGKVMDDMTVVVSKLYSLY